MDIKLENVRLSFPALFKPKSVAGSEPKYSAALILDKKNDAAQINALRVACAAMVKEKWPVKMPAGVKYCVHDGSEKEYDGFGPTIMFVSASSTIQPPVVDENLLPVTETSGKVYAGCFVNALIRLWAQDNQFGKRINAQLKAVQFAAEGEAFGDKPVDPASVFKSAQPQQENPIDGFGILGKPATRPAPQPAINEIADQDGGGVDPEVGF